MFDKLFAVVELSFVDTHTLLWGQEQLCHDTNCKMLSTVHNFINMSQRFTCIINFSYNLVSLFETKTLYQLCDKQQSYCICYNMNIVYLYCSTVVSIGYLR